MKLLISRYWAVPDHSGATAIVTHMGNSQTKVQKYLCGKHFIIVKNGKRYNINGILLDNKK